MRDQQLALRALAVVFLAAMLSVGCVNRGYLDKRLADTEGRLQDQIDDVGDQVEGNQTALEQQGVMVKRELEQLGASPKWPAVTPPIEEEQALAEAIERAQQGGMVDPGVLAAFVSLSGDRGYFGTSSDSLSREARSALAVAWAQIVALGDQAFIEVQGHTDAEGVGNSNLELGRKRAQAVRDYLVSEFGYPAERIAIVSYGDSLPVADNESPEGRSRNHRVTLVVLR